MVPHLDLIMEMIEKNIFRPLPVLKKQATNGEIGIDDDDVNALDRISLSTQRGPTYSLSTSTSYS